MPEKPANGDDTNPIFSQEFWRKLCKRYGLTPREVEVLSAIVSGESVESVARRLAISVHTVRAHMRKVNAKLDVDCRVALMNRIFSEPQPDATPP